MKKNLYAILGIPEPLAITFCTLCFALAAVTVVPSISIGDFDLDPIRDWCASHAWELRLLFLVSVLGFFPFFSSKEPKENPGRPPLTSLDIGSIVTHGENSPGVVQGDFHAGGDVNVNQKIINQYIKKQSKNWRKIYAAPYEVAVDIPDYIGKYFRVLLEAQVLSTSKYDRHTILIYFEDTRIGERDAVNIVTMSSRGDLLRSLIDIRNSQIRDIARVHNSKLPKWLIRKQLEKEINKEPDPIDGWELHSDFGGNYLRRFSRPVNIEIDPIARKLSLTRDPYIGEYGESLDQALET